MADVKDSLPGTHVIEKIELQGGLPGRLRRAWLLLLLAAFAIYPALIHPIERIAHDAGVEHIYRGVLFSRAISDGVLYPRWVQFLHLGLGGPLFTFQAPLPFYGMDLLYRLGIPHPFGWRLLMAAGIFGACAGTYLLVREVTRQRWPALVAAVAYIYAPYVIHNIFDRGSNEAYSMLLYPWVLWSLLWLARHPTAPRLVVATLLWAACIGFHVLGPLMLAPVAGLLALFLAWRYRTPAPLLALLAGGLLTAFIWAPIMAEMKFVRLDQVKHIPEAQPAENPIPLERLLAPPPIYDVLRGNNRLTDQAGLLHAVALLFGLPVTLLAWRQRRSGLAAFAGGTVLVGSLLFWLMTESGTPAWRLLDPVLGILEYRIRLMGLLALACSLLAGLAVALLPPRGRRYAGTALLALFILTALPSLYVDLLHEHAHFGMQITLEELREAELRLGGTAFTAFGETNPRWRELPLDREVAQAVEASPIAGTGDGVELERAEIRTSRWDLVVRSEEATTLTLHLLYYPRWSAYIDGQPVTLSPQEGSGLAQLELPPGQHQIALRYRRSEAESAGFLLSGLTLLALLGATIHALRQRGTEGGRSEPADGGGGASLASPPLWLLLGLTGLLLFKIFYIDPHTTWFRCQSTEEQLCSAQFSVDVPFEGAPRLRGYEVASYEVAPGEVLRVNVIWQGEPGIEQQLSSFVHLRNSSPDWPLSPQTGSDIWAQADHQVPGSHPTTDYVPGRLYWDEFRVPLPADIPPGEYLLEVGWYNPATGEQLAPEEASIEPPLRPFWHSVLLPSVTIK